MNAHHFPFVLVLLLLLLLGFVSDSRVRARFCFHKQPAWKRKAFADVLSAAWRALCLCASHLFSDLVMQNSTGNIKYVWSDLNEATFISSHLRNPQAWSTKFTTSFSCSGVNSHPEKMTFAPASLILLPNSLPSSKGESRETPRYAFWPSSEAR